MPALARTLLRLAAVWVIEALSLLLVARFVPGISLTGSDSTGVLVVAVSVALALGLLNTLLRPLIILLTLPLNVLTLGLSTLLVNAVMLRLTSYLMPTFTVAGWQAALVGALALAAANTLLSSLTTLDDGDGFYHALARWVSGLQAPPPVQSAALPPRGVVLLEIDGLSHERMERAIVDGAMPTVREMLGDGTHRLSPFDCGLPAQTSSCQAGIMYGDNDDIPAFRWYDKERGKMLVSNNLADAAELNARFARGHGLLREGSSIGNLMAGDAHKTLLTLSVLRDSDEDMARRRSNDLYLFFLNPYTLPRAVVLTLWDVVVEVFQALRQAIRNVQPRINRFRRGYPFLRALTNVFLRDLGTYMVGMDVLRGVPAIYLTYVGYDEVAHHAGPDTDDTLGTLRGLDVQIRRLRDLIRRQAPIPYDLFILSDHGQSVGATFRQRYGVTLAQLIQQWVREGVTVGEAAEAHATEGLGLTRALVMELEGVERRRLAGRVGRATLRRTRRSLASRLEHYAGPAIAGDRHVTVCASGNLAHVYFNLHTGKVPHDTLDAAHPGLVDALVTHPGIGFVVVYDAAGEPLVLGKEGARHLATGRVVGHDPLQPFGDADLRAQQLARVARFAHAGDLIVNSALYPDGQVAAFEELVGSHGGFGGGQTQPFVLHPADMTIPPTTNSADLFALLDARRTQPRPAATPAGAGASTAAATPSPWAWQTLWAGMRALPSLLARAGRALWLDRTLYREVADDPLATGQALVILAAVALTEVLVGGLTVDAAQPILFRAVGLLGGGLASWLSLLIMAQLAVRWQGGDGDINRAFRALAFAQVPELLGVLRPLPFLGPMLYVVAIVLRWLAVWVALQESQDLEGWVAALIPLAALAIAAVTVLVAGLLFSGSALTWDALLWHLGLLTDL